MIHRNFLESLAATKVTVSIKYPLISAINILRRKLHQKYFHKQRNGISCRKLRESHHTHTARRGVDGLQTAEVHSLIPSPDFTLCQARIPQDHELKQVTATTANPPPLLGSLTSSPAAKHQAQWCFSSAGFAWHQDWEFTLRVPQEPPAAPWDFLQPAAMLIGQQTVYITFPGGK